MSSPAPDTEPPRCPGCAHLEGLLADRSAELEAAHRRIKVLEDSPARNPDKVIAAERDALAEENARLREELRQARRSDSPGRPEPVPGPVMAAEPATSPDGDLCARCGAPGAPAWERRPDGSSGSAIACDGCLAWFRAQHPDRSYGRGEPEEPPVTTEDEVDGMYVPSGDWDSLL